jgi:hypothetical protein
MVCRARVAFEFSSALANEILSSGFGVMSLPRRASPVAGAPGRSRNPRSPAPHFRESLSIRGFKSLLSVKS